MATAESNLSSYDPATIPDANLMRIGIVVSEWNTDITSNLLKGALEVIREAGIREENLKVIHVPGSFELPLGAGLLFQNENVHGVVALGSVIRGETAHFDYVCQAVAQGTKDVSLKFMRPVIFGVLTDDNRQQSIDRSGGKHGNKGTEAAVAVLKMVHLQRNLLASWGTGLVS